jgi:hypothetical protein
MVKTAGYLLAALGMTLLLGCQSSEERMQERLAMLVDPRLSQAVRDNLTALGGLDAWLEVDTIRAQALTTLRNEAGGDSFLEQCYLLYYGESCALTVETQEADAFSREMLLTNGTVQVFSNNHLVGNDSVLVAGAAVKLRLVLQALTGSAGLLDNNFNLSYQGVERQAGKVMHKVEMSGPLVWPIYPAPNVEKGQWVRPLDHLVLWIDAEKKLVERLWLSYPLDAKGDKHGYLAANVSDYKQLESGIQLPTLIELVPGDRYQQFSQRKIVTIQLLDIDVQTTMR